MLIRSNNIMVVIVAAEFDGSEALLMIADGWVVAKRKEGGKCGEL